MLLVALQFGGLLYFTKGISMESLQQNEATEKIPDGWTFGGRVPPRLPNIYQRLNAASLDMQTIIKTGLIVTEKRTYSVATAEDISAPVRKAIFQNGLAFLCNMSGCDVKPEDSVNKYGNKVVHHLITLDMIYTFINIDKPDERIDIKWHFVHSDADGEAHKAIGKALTYAQKYFFNQFFILARDDNDPDLDKNKDQDKKQGKNPPPYSQEPKTQQAPSQQIHPPTNGNENPQTQPPSPPATKQPQSPPVNGNGSPKATPQPPPVAAQLRDDCVAFLKSLALGADLEKEFFSSFEAGASMLSQIPDTKISTVHSFLKYACETRDPIETITDHITKQKLFTEIRNSKDTLLGSAKFSSKQLDDLIVAYTKGRPHTTLSNDDLTSIVDALNKKIAELNIENGKKKQQ